MDVKREEKLEQMERIVQSQALHGSEHLRAFLRYVVQKAADNQDSQLKEYVIATEVLGRNSDFDPRTESVVRVQAGRLRSKLHEYYASEGKHDKVLIDLPKGHYTPAFSYIQHENGSANHHGGNGSTVANAGLETSIVPPAPEQPQSTKRTPWQLAVVVLAVLSLTLGLLTLRYRSEGKQLRKALAVQTADSPDMRLLNALWSDFFSSPEPILVAYSNTIFQGRAETGMKILKPYDSPASSFESPLSSLPQRAGAADSGGGAVISDHYTGVGEVMSVYHLGNLFFKANHPYRVKRSLLLSWDDLKTQNIVMLGSPAENLLLRGLPQEQSFVFKILKDERQKPRYGIANLNPRRASKQPTCQRKKVLRPANSSKTMRSSAS